MPLDIIFTSYRLNMFQALLCPSSEARDYDVVNYTGRFVRDLMHVHKKSTTFPTPTLTIFRAFLQKYMQSLIPNFTQTDQETGEVPVKLINILK